MTSKRFSVFIFLTVFLTVSVGISAAHDTGSPHTHDPIGEINDVAAAITDACAPMTHDFHAHLSANSQTGSSPEAYLVVPLGGKSLPLYWLLHFMQGEIGNHHRDFVHNFMHWHGIEHAHTAGAPEEASVPPAAPKLYD